MTPQYKIWRDHANNLGIQCTVCHKTFWTGNESTFDPSIGAPCHNCELIKSQRILENENAMHFPSEDGSSPYPYSQPLPDIKETAEELSQDLWISPA